MKATISHVARDDEGDFVDVTRAVDLPFVPPIGTYIKADDSGNYLRVLDFYIDLTTDPAEIQIGVSDPLTEDGIDVRPLARLLREGWETDDE